MVFERLAKTKCLKASYRISTPMFLGGAFQEELDPARGKEDAVPSAASVKGALRFWWRALYWSDCWRDAKGNETQALKLLHEQEARLWGCAATGEDSAQSAVVLRLHSQGKGRPPEDWKSIAYLLGQGLYGYKNGITRPYTWGQEVTVTVSQRPVAADANGVVLTDADWQQVRRTLMAFGLLGGLGSRSRRGLGSWSLQSIEGEGLDQKQEIGSPEDIRKFVRDIRPDAPAPWQRTPLTAFTDGTRIDISLTKSKAGLPAPFELLKQINNEFQLFRSYGRDGKVGRDDARRNFPGDHDRVLEAIQRGQPLRNLPQRAIFGLPHNYHFSSIGRDLQLAPGNNGEGRRASPLLMHVHEFPDGSAAVVQSLLPGIFLPQGMGVQQKPKGGQATRVADTEVDFKVIQRYLDGAFFAGKMGCMTNGK